MQTWKKILSLKDKKNRLSNAIKLAKSIEISFENDSERLVGLTAIYVFPVESIQPSDVLSISVAGSSLPVIKKTNLIPKSRFTFHIHNHLLPVGHVEICFSLRDASGVERFSSVSVIRLSNDGRLSDSVKNILAEHNVPWGFFGPCDAGRYPYDAISADKHLTPWFDRPDGLEHIDNLLRQGLITEAESGYLRSFVQNGFMIIEGLIDDDLLDNVNQEIDWVIETKYKGYEYGSSQRIEHLHLHQPNTRKLWLDKRHRRLNDLLFEGVARPCQTLTFIFGSQQEVHQDTIHLTTFPAGFMTGTWIALQDVAADSGELIYYPGSHRSKRLYLKDTGASKIDGDWTEFSEKVLPLWEELAKSFEPVVYRPKRGTIAIWHENLLHGGSARLDEKLERRSIVIHSYAAGSIAYADAWGGAGIAATTRELEEN